MRVGDSKEFLALLRHAGFITMFPFTYEFVVLKVLTWESNFGITQARQAFTDQGIFM